MDYDLEERNRASLYAYEEEQTNIDSYPKDIEPVACGKCGRILKY